MFHKALLHGGFLQARLYTQVPHALLIIFSLKMFILRGVPGVQWLGFGVFTAMARVQSLVG